VKLTVNVRAVPAIGVHAASVVVVLVDVVVVVLVLVLTVVDVDDVVGIELVVVLPTTVEVVITGQVQSS
jgi:5-bromo-4-chloroindolyl phosphate hydrolysis protein